MGDVCGALCVFATAVVVVGVDDQGMSVGGKARERGGERESISHRSNVASGPARVRCSRSFAAFSSQGILNRKKIYCSSC